MADLASLGIVVKTTGVKEAARELGGLTKEGAAAEKQAARVSESWKKAGKAIGIGVAAGISVAGLALRKYFQNTIEAERVQSQLEARIKSTGMAARLSLGDLNKMAQALQFKTSFDDESIGGVQALLLTFTKIGRETFPEATEAVLNLSTAMGTDLNSAALQVGKALNDPVKGITALSRAGVQFSAAQKTIIKDLVKTGDVAGAQAVILKELEVQMGGAAVAARNTLGGALQALKNSFDNVLEGDSGNAGIRGTRDAIESLNRTLNDPGIKRGVDSTVSGLLRITNAAITLIAKLGDAGSALSEFFGSADKRSRQVLENQKTELETREFAQQRALKNSQSLGPMGAVLTALNGGALRDTRGKLAEINAELSKIDKFGEGRKPIAALFSTDGAIPENMLQPRAISAALEDEDKKKGRARAKREMPDFSKEDAEDLRRLIEQTAAADTAFEGLAATLAGPLEAAQFRYKQNLEEITELGTIAGRSSQEIAAAKELETKRYAEERAEIEKSLDVYGQLIADKQFELDLMGMSNAERQTAIDLQRLGREATEEEAAAIRDLNQAYEDTNRTIDMMDDFRRSASNNLADFVKGTKSAKDAALDFLGSIADMLIEMAAQQLVAKAFGDQGSTGAGTSGGGWLSQIFGLFGGSGSSGMQGSLGDLMSSSGDWGWADGGFTGMGPKSQVAGPVHKGEYVINADATRNLPRGYLDALNDGEMPSMGGGNVTNVTTFVLPNRYTPQTQAQIAQETNRVQQRAQQRNG